MDTAKNGYHKKRGPIAPGDLSISLRFATDW